MIYEKSVYLESLFGIKKEILKFLKALTVKFKKLTRHFVATL